MRRVLAVTALVVSLVALAGCGSKRLSDGDYVLICDAYREGAAFNRGPAVALHFTIDHFHMSREDAANAVATARREYCP